MNGRIPVALIGASAAAITLIMSWEGFRADSYQCPAGTWTIGYGTTSGVKPGQVITREEAEKLLKLDVAKFEKNMRYCVKVPVSQKEWDAYTSFAYNVGVGNFCNSTLVKRLNAGRRVDACNELSKWIYAGGKAWDGLRNRREAERQMCMKGVRGE